MPQFPPMKEFDKGVLLNRKVLYSGRIVGLHVDDIKVKGMDTIREVISHPGGVVVLAEVEDGRIPFVRQYRYPIEKDLLELPAGKIDPGEPPEVSARRELEEETGLTASGPVLIDVIYQESLYYGTSLLIIGYMFAEYSGDLSAGDDASEARFFPAGDLPPLAFKSHESIIAAALKKI